jgi:urease subunit alpha
VIFVSTAALKSPALQKLKLSKPLVAVKKQPEGQEENMIHNDWLPRIDVDPETYQVRADGELLVCEPASELPLAQRYFLF